MIEYRMIRAVIDSTSGYAIFNSQDCNWLIIRGRGALYSHTPLANQRGVSLITQKAGRSQYYRSVGVNMLTGRYNPDLVGASWSCSRKIGTAPVGVK